MCMLCACGEKEVETQTFKFDEISINASGKSVEDFLKELTDISEMESAKVVSDTEIEIQVTKEQKEALSKDFEKSLQETIEDFSGFGDGEDGQYELADDYEKILFGKEATAEMKEFLSEYFEPSDIQVYMDVYKVSEGDTAPRRAIGVPDMMINGVYSEEDVENAAMAYAEWMKETHHREAGKADFRLYRVEDYEEINEFNYTDYFGDEIVDLEVCYDSDEPTSITRY